MVNVFATFVKTNYHRAPASMTTNNKKKYQPGLYRKQKGSNRGGELLVPGRVQKPVPEVVVMNPNPLADPVAEHDGVGLRKKRKSKKKRGGDLLEIIDMEGLGK